MRHMVIPTRMKECKSCLTYFPEDNFNKFSRSKDGLAYKCKPCSRKEQRDYANSQIDTKAFYRSRNLRKYGITQEDYDQLLKDQKGVCAICEQPETKVWKGAVQRLSVDHCHETGRVRGLLCNSCNRALGKFQDSPSILRSAYEYLTR